MANHCLVILDQPMFQDDQIRMYKNSLTNTPSRQIFTVRPFTMSLFNVSRSSTRAMIILV